MSIYHGSCVFRPDAGVCAEADAKCTFAAEMGMEMVSIWVPKVCQIGALDSQIIVVFGMSMVCFYNLLSI